MGLLAGFKEISFFPTVPTLINAMLKHPEGRRPEPGPEDSSLLNSGAAPMPLELIEQVKDLGISYSEGWGMSETTSLGISNPVFGLRKTGQHRHPLAGYGCQAGGCGQRKGGCAPGRAG